MKSKNNYTFFVAALLCSCNSASDNKIANKISTQPTLSPFIQAVLSCNRPTALLTYRCVYNHPLKSGYTMEEKERISYFVVMHEKASKGEISQAEADYATTSYMNKLQAQKEEVARQNASIAQTNAVIAAQQQAQTSAALGEMGAALMIAGQPKPAVIYPAPAPMFNTPRQTTCSRNNQFLNCTTY